MKKRILRIGIACVAVMLVASTALAMLVFNGYILLNGHRASGYAVKGVDVSSYQGEIDWQVLAEQGISFAYIKATEGSSFTDKRFDYNFAEAQKTSLYVGAYHFFSFDSAGATQADNFIKSVIPFEGMLPPVVDVEFYGDKEKNPAERDAVTVQLKEMLCLLEEHYGQKPIIYSTKKAYETYLADDYSEYDIWIRNVITAPRISDGRAWRIWQYTNRGRLDGYNGEERFIDINVFNGTSAEFDEFVKNRGYAG